MTQQQIEEIKKEFFDEFVQDNGENIEPSFGDPNGSVGPVWQFIEQKLREVEEKVLRDFINYLSEDIGRTADRDEAMEQNAKLYSYYEEQLCEYLKNKLEGKDRKQTELNQELDNYHLNIPNLDLIAKIGLDQIKSDLKSNNLEGKDE